MPDDAEDKGAVGQPGNQAAQDRRPACDYRPLWVPLVAIVLGALFGAIDVHRADACADWLCMAAAAALGFLHPKTCWLSAAALTCGLYAVHLAAISHGAAPPYVEADADGARACLLSIMPNGLCALVGAGVGLFERAG